MTRPFVVLLVGCTIGCSAPGRSASFGRAVISTLGATDVSGTQIDNYLADDGKLVPGPVDLSATAITATFRNPDGSFATVSGSGDAGGNFIIPGVPAGNYALRLGNNPYILTDARVLDLGSLRMGRRPGPQLATRATRVFLDLTNLNPWTEDDFFDALASNVGAYGIDMTLFANPGDGETISPPGMGFDYQSDMRPPALVEAERGDRLVIDQFTKLRSTRGYEYFTPVRGFIAPPFTQSDGEPTTIGGAMEAVKPATVRLRWLRSIPNSFRSQVRIGAVTNFSVLLIAKARSEFSLTPAPTLLTSVLERGPGAGTDLDESFAYGVPAEPDWPLRFAQLQFSYFVSYQLPDTQPFLTSSFNVATVPLATIEAGAFGALVGPVTNLTVNGECATSDLGDITLPATVSWDQPALGETNWYNVTVYRVIDAGGRTTLTTQGAISTADSTVTLPPEMLAPGGGTYAIGITGGQYTRRDSEHPLATTTFPWGRADAFTGILTTR